MRKQITLPNKLSPAKPTKQASFTLTPPKVSSFRLANPNYDCEDRSSLNLTFKGSEEANSQDSMLAAVAPKTRLKVIK